MVYLKRNKMNSNIFQEVFLLKEVCHSQFPTDIYNILLEKTTEIVYHYDKIDLKSLVTRVEIWIVRYYLRRNDAAWIQQWMKDTMNVLENCDWREENSIDSSITLGDILLTSSKHVKTVIFDIKIEMTRGQVLTHTAATAAEEHKINLPITLEDLIEICQDLRSNSFGRDTSS